MCRRLIDKVEWHSPGTALLSRTSLLFSDETIAEYPPLASLSIFRLGIPSWAVDRCFHPTFSVCSLGHFAPQLTAVIISWSLGQTCLLPKESRKFVKIPTLTRK